MLVWARVYFYVVIGVVASLAFFNSPGKAWLSRKLKQRNQSVAPISGLASLQKQPLLGLPEDPGRDMDEAVAEIKQEVEARQRRGSKLQMPSADEIKKELEQTVRNQQGR